MIRRRSSFSFCTFASCSADKTEGATAVAVAAVATAMTGVGSLDCRGDEGSFLALPAELAPPALPPLPLALFAPPLTPPAVAPPPPPPTPPPETGVDETSGGLTALILGLFVVLADVLWLLLLLLLLLLLIPLIDSNAAVVVLPNEPLPPLRAETAPTAEAVNGKKGKRINRLVKGRGDWKLGSVCNNMNERLCPVVR